MNEQQPNALGMKSLISPTLFGIISLVCAVMTVFCPVLLPVTLALGSACFAMTRLLDPFGIVEKLLPVLFFIVTLLTVKSLSLAVFLLGIFFPAGIALSDAARRHQGFNSGVAKQFLTLCIYLLILFGVILVEYGVDLDPESIIGPFRDTVKGFLAEAYPLINKQMANMLNPYLAVLPYTQENFTYAFYRLFSESLPLCFCLVILGASALSYWTLKCFVYRRYKGHGIPEQLKFFGSFDTVSASKMAGVIYILLSLVELLAVNTFEALLFATFKGILAAVFCYEAVSVVAFALKMYNIPQIVRIFICLLLGGMCLFAPVALSVCSLVGLMDCFYGIRRFINPAGYVV